MAFKQTVELRDSFDDIRTFESAYQKVKSLTGTKQSIFVIVETYRSKEDQRILDSNGYTFIPDMNYKNFIAQAYEHLKTLPEFAGAADC